MRANLPGWALLLLIPLFPLPASARSAAASPVEITETEARETFDFMWETVRDTHFDSTLNGVDWTAVREELLPAAADCGNLDALRAILRTALGRLGQSHFGILPGSGADGEASPAVSLEQVFTAVPDHAGRPGIGIELQLLDREMVVVDVDPAGSAARAGVRPGWTVESIGDESVDRLGEQLNQAYPHYQPGGQVYHAYYLTTLASAHLAGDAGSSVSVRFRDLQDQPRSLVLERTEPRWPLFAVGGMPPLPVRVEARYLEGDSPRRIGYVKIHTIWLPGTVAAFETALERVADADALIVDIRGNMGGFGLAAQGVAGYLTRDPFSLGVFISRQGRFENPVQPRRADRSGSPFEPWDSPLAILIDGLSQSSSELFAAGFQDAGRARLFGEPTAGVALPATITPLPSGDRLLHAIFDYVRPNGDPIEGNPVQPDVPARLSRRDLISGRDPALEAAVEWIHTLQGGP